MRLDFLEKLMQYTIYLLLPGVEGPGTAWSSGAAVDYAQFCGGTAPASGRAVLKYDAASSKTCWGEAAEANAGYICEKRGNIN